MSFPGKSEGSLSHRIAGVSKLAQAGQTLSHFLISLCASGCGPQGPGPGSFRDPASHTSRLFPLTWEAGHRESALNLRQHFHLEQLPRAVLWLGGTATCLYAMAMAFLTLLGASQR